MKEINLLLSYDDRMHLSMLYTDNQAYDYDRKIEVLKCHVPVEAWEHIRVDVDVMEFLYTKFR